MTWDIRREWRLSPGRIEKDRAQKERAPEGSRGLFQRVEGVPELELFTCRGETGEPDPE